MLAQLTTHQERPCRCLAIGATAGMERQAGIRELSTPSANMQRPAPAERTMRLRPGIDRPPDAGTRVDRCCRGRAATGQNHDKRIPTTTRQLRRDWPTGPTREVRVASSAKIPSGTTGSLCGRGDGIRLRRIAASLQVRTHSRAAPQLQVSQGLTSSGSLDAEYVLTFMTNRQVTPCVSRTTQFTHAIEQTALLGALRSPPADMASQRAPE